MNQHLKIEKQKNGLLELMRFLCAASVILFHMNKDVWKKKLILLDMGWMGKLTPAKNGNICVEFFFLLSGLFMAKTIYDSLHKESNGIPLCKETALYTWKKAKRVMFYYIPACVLYFLLSLLFKNSFSFWRIISYLPSFLFLQRTGVAENSFLIVSWYLCSLLIATAILYPICKKYYDLFTRLYGPLLAILLIGIMIKETRSLGGVWEWMGFTYKANLRAIAGISLGMTCFEVGRRLKEAEFSESGRIGITLIGFAAYTIAFLYFYSSALYRYSGIIELILCVAVTISFSEVGYLCSKEIFQKKLFFYLGSISLPMFLLQDLFRQIVSHMIPEEKKRLGALIIFFGTLTSAILFELVKSQVMKLRSAHRVVS